MGKPGYFSGPVYCLAAKEKRTKCPQVPVQPPNPALQQEAECPTHPEHPADIPAPHKVSLRQLLPWQLR